LTGFGSPPEGAHMIPAPAGTAAQWTSFWASLTFELPNVDATRNQHGLS